MFLKVLITIIFFVKFDQNSEFLTTFEFGFLAEFRISDNFLKVSGQILTGHLIGWSTDRGERLASRPAVRRRRQEVQGEGRDGGPSLSRPRWINRSAVGRLPCNSVCDVCSSAGPADA